MSNSNMVLSLLIKGVDAGATLALRGINTGLGATRIGLNTLNTSAQATTRGFVGMYRALNGFSEIAKLTGGYLSAQGAMTFTSNVVALEKAMLGVKANIMSGVGSAQELTQQLNEVRKTARDLSNVTMFSDTQNVEMVNQLLKSGVKLKDVKGHDGAAYATASLAQLGGVAPETAAAQIGSLGNAFSFKSPKQYKELADQIVRVDDASSMKTSDILYNSQLVSASSAQLKIDPKRMIAALGYLDPLGNMAGTSLNRFFEGLGGTTKGKEAALKKSGMNFWQKNADGTETLKDVGAVIEIVRQKFRAMKSDREKLKLGHKLFGEEGGRAAAFFASKETSFAEFEQGVAKASSASAKMEVSMEGLGSSFDRLKNTAFAAAEDNTAGLRKGATWATNKATDSINNGHGVALGVGVAGAAILARLAYKKLPGMVANWAGSGANLASGVALGKTLEKVAGITPVFVTNMPSGGLGDGNNKPSFGKAVVDNAGGIGAAATAARGAAALTATGAIGLTAGAAVIASAPILLAGGYMQEKMNSPEGLQERMTAREEKLKELAQLMQYEKSAGNDKAAARLQKEFDAANKDREAFLEALKEKTDQPIHVQVVMPDGRVLAEVVNEVTAQNFRRR